MWRFKQIFFAMVSIGFVFMSFAQSGLDSRYANKTKEYRNAAAAAAGTGTNANKGLARTASALLPVNDTNSGVIVNYETFSLSTNGLNIQLIQKSTNLTVNTSVKQVIRSMTVAAIFRAGNPWGDETGVIDPGIKISVAKNSGSSVVAINTKIELITHSTLQTFTNTLITLTADVNSAAQAGTALNANVVLPAATNIGNAYTATIKPAGGSTTFDSFINGTTDGAWTVKFDNPSSFAMHVVGFTLTFTGDPSSVTVGGKSLNILSRKSSEQNPTLPNGTHPFPRAQSEK